VGAIEIPFGSDGASLDDDLRMVVDIKSPMALADYFTFATYPSDMYNLPMPFGASNLDVEVRKVVDRYWIVQPSSISNMAPLDILFSYTSQDISSGSNAINPDKLLAARNNTVAAEWLDMYPRGQNYLNTVTISNVLPSEFYPTWTLVNMPPPLTDLFAPDAFSPNGDGVNDLFYPVFQVDFQITSYELFIYNRWGKLVFNTKDINQGWNGVQSGSNAEPLIDVYSWLIIVSGHHNENQNISGKKRKFTGRVTLIL
jgi:gliding motility-associated-like protein